MADAFPLSWPPGWPRTPPIKRARGRYSVTFDRSRRDLIRELRLMEARSVIISSNIPLRNDGLPYASGFKRVTDPGIAVYFMRNGEHQVVACDSWETVDGNIRAIGLTIGDAAMMARINRAWEQAQVALG